jgi:CRISPR/Cas system CSM-associated protein Csm3 (group 7 of RAMP superfamily)
VSRYIYRISGTVNFPEGVMPGEGGDSNILTVARNGQDKPVLRGTSLAGALRAAFPKNKAEYWFGKELKSKEDKSDDSRIIVADMILNIGSSTITNRTHNQINRHTGAIIEKGLFSIESLPPDTTGKLLLYINSRSGEKDGENSEAELIEKISTIFGSGLTIGGNRNRGIGRLECTDTLVLNRFDISTIEGYAAWMNARYADRTGTPIAAGEKLPLKSGNEQFVLDVTLGIPRGEDFVIGYGKTMGHLAEPQKVKKTDGKEYWRIPGSSIRGVFREWMTRLAVVDGKKKVRDDAGKFFNDREITGDLIGWGFVKDKNERAEIQNNPDLLDDPIMSLFGSMYRRGRIHIPDAFSNRPVETKDTQLRAHVAIDRFSGGANEGMLFDNTVLIGDVQFILRISIDSPLDDELKWLEKTLKALHLGILSIGSSKGSGRLEIKTCVAGSEKAQEIAEHIIAFVEKNNG